MPKEVYLTEAFPMSFEGKVDVDNRIIRDVAVINRTSVNCSFKEGKGRVYEDSALDDICRICEGTQEMTDEYRAVAFEVAMSTGRL